MIKLTGPPNSYVLGGGDRVFETDAQGQVVRDITPLRYNIRSQNTDPLGMVRAFMDKTHRKLTPEDYEILRRMGVIK